LFNGYCYLDNFGWELGADPIQDDPRLFNMNIKQRCDDFASQVRGRAPSYRTNNILVPFGCDFQFENANMEFKNMDKIIKYINSHPEYKMTLKYSTPSMYVDAVHSTGLSWELNQFDFFPFAGTAISNYLYLQH
jgi:lysosomal alpha-mannosidase